MPRTPARRTSPEALSSALHAIHTHHGGFAHQLAARLGMSQRTLARFTLGQSVPTRMRALAMLATLTYLPAELYHPLADALAIASDERPLLRATATPVVASATSLPVDRTAEETALTLMLYVTAEANGVAPGAARKVALAMLDHLTSRGLDVATGREVTRAAEKRLTAKRG